MDAAQYMEELKKRGYKGTATAEAMEKAFEDEKCAKIFKLVATHMNPEVNGERESLTGEISTRQRLLAKLKFFRQQKANAEAELGEAKDLRFKQKRKSAEMKDETIKASLKDTYVNTNTAKLCSQEAFRVLPQSGEESEQFRGAIQQYLNAEQLLTDMVLKYGDATMILNEGAHSEHPVSKSFNQIEGDKLVDLNKKLAGLKDLHAATVKKDFMATVTLAGYQRCLSMVEELKNISPLEVTRSMVEAKKRESEQIQAECDELLNTGLSKHTEALWNKEVEEISDLVEDFQARRLIYDLFVLKKTVQMTVQLQEQKDRLIALQQILQSDVDRFGEASGHIGAFVGLVQKCLDNLASEQIYHQLVMENNNVAVESAEGTAATAATDKDQVDWKMSAEKALQKMSAYLTARINDVAVCHEKLHDGGEEFQGTLATLDENLTRLEKVLKLQSDKFDSHIHEVDKSSQLQKDRQLFQLFFNDPKGFLKALEHSDS